MASAKHTEQNRNAARHDPEGPRESSLLRGLHSERPGLLGPQVRPGRDRGRIQVQARPVRLRIHRGHGGRNGEGDAKDHRPHRALRGPAGEDEGEQVSDQKGPHRQETQDMRGVSQVEEPSRVDDPDDDSRSSPRPEAACASRRRAIRGLRPKRPLQEGHQQEQQAEEAPGTRGSRHNSQKRKADAPGVGGRASRERKKGKAGARPQPQASKEPKRHNKGKAGKVQAEPPGQEGGLLRPLRHHRGARPAASPVRDTQADGA